MHLSLVSKDCPACFESNPQRHKLLLLIGASALILLGRNPAVLAQTVSAAQVAQRLQSQQLWVNPQTGNDKADGSEQAPFRTLTHALQMAGDHTIIQLAAGTYSTTTGEVFPLILKSGVTVQGNREQLGHGIVIRGGGSYNSASLGNQNVTFVGTSQTMLLGVTVTNPNTRGQGFWVEAGSPVIRDSTFMSNANTGIVAAGSSAPLVQNNLFLLNRLNGMMIAGNAQANVQGNTFQRTGSGLMIGDNAAPQVINNRISQNRDGIVVQGNAQPLLRNNTIEDSEQDGLVVIAQAQPNLGTANDPGNNVFLNSRQHDINALTTSQILPAFGNQVASSGLAGKIDLTGNAPLISVTTVASTADRLPITQATRVSVLPPSTALSGRPASSITQPPLIASLPPTRSELANRLPDSQPSRSANPSANRSTNQFGNQSGNQSGGRTILVSASTVAPAPATTEPRQTKPAQPVLNPSVVSVLANQPASTNQPALVNQPIVPISVPRSVPANLGASSARLSSSARSVERSVEIAVPPPVSSRSANQFASTGQVNVGQASSVQANLTQANPTQANSTQLASVAVTAPASLPRQDFSNGAVAAPTLGGTPIKIPVPPPERQQAASQVTAANATAANVTAANTTAAASTPRTSLLPVPTGTIPVGNAGDMPRVSISGSESGGVLLASASQNLQYRVVVAASDEQTTSLVRSVAPDAFSTWINGQSMLQIGAFSSRENAQDAVDQLSRSGLTGIIQPMD